MTSSVWLPASLATASLMRAEVHRAGVAVDQRDAVEEEAGGEGAEQEVLHRGLLAEQAPAAGQAAEQVEREREHLERDEHREQVAGRREQHHAADREQQQRVDLGVVEARGGLALGLGAGQRGGLAGERRDARPRPGARRRAGRRRGRRPGQAPQEHGRAVDAIVPSEPNRPRAAPSPSAAGRVRDEADADQRGHQRRPGSSRTGRGSAAARGRNASIRTPRQAAPKTSRIGQSAPYSMVRLDEACPCERDHCCPPCGRSCDRHGRRRVWYADVLQRVVDVGVDHVEQRHRVEAEEHQRQQQRRERCRPHGGRGRGSPPARPPGSVGAGHRALVHPQHVERGQHDRR